MCNILTTHTKILQHTHTVALSLSTTHTLSDSYSTQTHKFSDKINYNLLLEKYTESTHVAVFKEISPSAGQSRTLQACCLVSCSATVLQIIIQVFLSLFTPQSVRQSIYKHIK
ncbi:hypothetical protein AMECASPLE_006937 [Ameca splendens]|uniref:Uncharacterized protein n=1 Tax=Ameca splendens TaxID=208324 RepID=A0ABV0YAR3_9TELE